jgi:transposase-like protein
MATDLTAKIYTDEDAARAHFESLRWPDGRVCPHCGVIGQSTLMQGRTTRPGLYKCNACRKPFTAVMGTVYEKSHIPLHKWLLATHLLVSSKKGMSAHQLFRMLGFGSYRTAWFMAHRIREAMNGGPASPPMGEGGGAVEVDETFIGNLKEKPKAKGGAGHKMKVVSLVDRDSGRARSYVVGDLSMKTIIPILEANISRQAHLMTDEAPRYASIGWNYAAHGVVNHGKDEYVRYEPGIVISTNRIEGYFSVFKRGMRGVYQHCGEQHLFRYMNEFDFRYSNRAALGVTDDMRAVLAVKGAVGKRLTYRRTDGLKAA